MPSLTLKYLPQELYDRLKTSAKLHRRSLNGEAIHHLANALMPKQVGSGDFLNRLDVLHARLKLPPATQEFLEEATAEGRP